MDLIKLKIPLKFDQMIKPKTIKLRKFSLKNVLFLQ